MSGQDPRPDESSDAEQPDPTSPDDVSPDDTGPDDTGADSADSADSADHSAETEKSDEDGDSTTPATASAASAASATSAAPAAKPRTGPDCGDRPDLARRRADDTEEPHRRRWLIAGIAAVVVIVLAIGITVFALRAQTPDATPDGSGTPTSSSSSDGALLTVNRMLSPAQAALITDKQTWKVTSDQQGESSETSTPACLSTQATEDEPMPQQLLSRTLTGSAKDTPVVLHQARAFASPEEATQAYALLAKALGECDLADSYLLSGAVVTGLGDQSTAVVVDDQDKKQLRTVVVSRTGRAVNVLDVVTPQSAGDAPLKGAVDALGKVTNAQCTAAVGLCASLVQVREGPPPVAGDQPGFLAVADIPRPEAGVGTWAGLAPAKPDNLVTSGCENVTFSKIDATASTSRSYLLSDKPKGMPAAFGIDEAVFTMDDEKAAAALTKQISDNIADCKDRQLTATVADPTSVSGAGAGQVKISGRTFAITQKVSDTATSTFRVGIVTAGTKVVYVFLPTEDKFDLTDDQWDALVVRAGARATQVS